VPGTSPSGLSVQHAGQRGPDFHLEAAVAVLGTGELAEVGLMCVYLGTELQVAPPVIGSNLWVAEAQGGGGRRLAGLAHHLVPLRVSTMLHEYAFTYIYSSMFRSCRVVTEVIIGIRVLVSFY